MNKLFLGVFCVFLLGCSYSKPLEIQGFNQEQFKTDRSGCKGLRKDAIEQLKTNKDKFLGISENEIMKALGKYDYQVLEERNEKIFIYFLEPGAHCQSTQNPTEAESLILYMNAVKLVKEVDFRKGGHIKS